MASVSEGSATMNGGRVAVPGRRSLRHRVALVAYTVSGIPEPNFPSEFVYVRGRDGLLVPPAAQVARPR